MSLLISGDLRMAKGYSLPDDADAVAYIAAVEAADGQALETATRMAINSFVKGCKNDGIWPAIKASCILAGARTRLGALTPLAGTAPTSFNFVDGDYNRKVGLVGGTAGKTLNSNRNNNADPQDNNHNAVYPTFTNVGSPFMGTQVNVTGANAMFPGGTRNRNATTVALPATATANALVGHSRSSSANYTQRANGASTLNTQTSQTPQNANVTVFGYTHATTLTSRLAFYSIGESLDLALLDTRVTTLINAFAAAIP
jgi:hypothetical protein